MMFLEEKRMKYLEMSLEELKKEKEIVEAEYRELKGKGMSLDLSRGKPGKKPHYPHSLPWY